MTMRRRRRHDMQKCAYQFITRKFKQNDYL
jgi:hypothetical protein